MELVALLWLPLSLLFLPTLLVYIAFKFLYMINKKRQEQLDDKYNDEDE